MKLDDAIHEGMASLARFASRLPPMVARAHPDTIREFVEAKGWTYRPGGIGERLNEPSEVNAVQMHTDYGVVAVMHDPKQSRERVTLMTNEDHNLGYCIRPALSGSFDGKGNP